MSGGNGEATAIVALALAVRHAPARHPELLRGNAPLPAGVGILLRLAGGSSLHELDHALVALAPESELRKAAMFFIEEVLFRRDADHYRLLGLNRDATPEQIKEHHRLLMRMFHPDRDSGLEDRHEQFATRANLAYNTLRDAGMRADYDSSIRPPVTKAMHAPRRPPLPARRRMVQPESFWEVRVHPLLMRYLPQWVLAGTALVSLAIVGVVYLSNPPVQLSPAPATADAIPASKPALAEEPAQDYRVDIAAGGAGGLDEVVAQFERKIAAAKAAMTPNAAAQDENKAKPVAQPVRVVQAQPAKAVPVTAVRDPPAVPVSPTTAPARARTLAASPAPKPAPARMPTQQTSAMEPDPASSVAPAVTPKAEPEPAPRLAAAVTSPMPKAVEAPVPKTVEATAPRPAQPDPNALLARFLEAYERGDIQTCMALLDEGMRTDAGGKPELRREYDTLFRNTDLRHIRITNMSWSRDGEFIRGEGRYRATFMRKGETVLRTQDGQVRVEMVRRGSTALINELHYLASGRS